jgi:hypothetical protein
MVALAGAPAEERRQTCPVAQGGAFGEPGADPVLEAARDLPFAHRGDLQRQESGREDALEVGVEPVRLGRHRGATGGEPRLEEGTDSLLAGARVDSAGESCSLACEPLLGLALGVEGLARNVHAAALETGAEPSVALPVHGHDRACSIH